MKRLFTVAALLLLLPPLIGVALLARVAVRAPVAPAVVAPYNEFPIAAAERALRRDDPLLAIGYYSQVEEDDPGYARAQRMIGYEVYTRRLDRPEAGLRFVLRSLERDAGSENAWRDTARVFWSAIAR